MTSLYRKRTGTGDTRSSSDGECDDDDVHVSPLLRTISVDTEVQNEEGSYASSSSLDSATPSSKRKFFQVLFPIFICFPHNYLLIFLPQINSPYYS